MPAGRLRITVRVELYEQVPLRAGLAGLDDLPPRIGLPVHRSGDQAVPGCQVVDRAGQSYEAAVDQHEVVR